MELRHFRYFVAAAEEQHMTRASQRLHITQPALSEQIRELESELGFPLFERLPRGLRLTRTGEVFLDHARRLLADVARACEHSCQVGRGETGRLRIAFNEIGGQQRLVGQTLHLFRQAYPDVALDMMQLTAQEQLAALRQENLDAGFQHSHDRADDPVDFLKMHTAEMMIAMPCFHALVQRDRVCMEDLRHEPQIWMHRSVNAVAYDRLRAAFAARGITPSVIQETRSDVSILNLVSVGLGLGLVVSASRWGESANVVVKRVEDLSLPVDFGLVWRQGDTSPLLANFIALLAQAIGNSRGRVAT